MSLLALRWRDRACQPLARHTASRTRMPATTGRRVLPGTAPPPPLALALLLLQLALPSESSCTLTQSRDGPRTNPHLFGYNLGVESTI